jgi:hypothetical protein
MESLPTDFTRSVIRQHPPLIISPLTSRFSLRSSQRKRIERMPAHLAALRNPILQRCFIRRVFRVEIVGEEDDELCRSVDMRIRWN